MSLINKFKYALNNSICMYIIEICDLFYAIISSAKRSNLKGQIYTILMASWSLVVVSLFFDLYIHVHQFTRVADAKQHYNNQLETLETRFCAVKVLFYEQFYAISPFQLLVS